jgi:hypothetical protein
MLTPKRGSTITPVNQTQDRPAQDHIREATFFVYLCNRLNPGIAISPAARAYSRPRRARWPPTNGQTVNSSGLASQGA